MHPVHTDLLPGICKLAHAGRSQQAQVADEDCVPKSFSWDERYPNAAQVAVDTMALSVLVALQCVCTCHRSLPCHMLGVVREWRRQGGQGGS